MRLLLLFLLASPALSAPQGDTTADDILRAASGASYGGSSSNINDNSDNYDGGSTANLQDNGDNYDGGIGSANQHSSGGDNYDDGSSSSNQHSGSSANQQDGNYQADPDLVSKLVNISRKKCFSNVDKFRICKLRFINVLISG